MNEEFVDFGELDLDYLLPESFRKKIEKEVMEEAEEIDFDNVKTYVLKPEKKGKSIRYVTTKY